MIPTSCIHYSPQGPEYGLCAVRAGGHDCATCCFVCRHRAARTVRGKHTGTIYQMTACESPCSGPVDCH